MFFGLLRRLVIAFALFLLVSLPAGARTFYVAKNGDNSYPGTALQPWLTIKRAADSLVAGDTVYIRQGTYAEPVRPRNSGSPGRYIVYAAYPGDSATVNGQGVSLNGWGLFQISGKQYIKVSGLRIINSPNYGLGEEASGHIIFEKNYVYNTVASGIIAAEFSGTNSNIIIDGNEVELACNDGAQECISLARTDTFEIKYNHVHHGGPGTNGGEGIDAKYGSSNGRIYGNHVHHLHRQGIYVDAWTGHTFNIQVFNNVVHDCQNQDGFDCASETGGILENVSFYNNVAYHNSCNGFRFAGWGGSPGLLRNITVVNNTFFRNGFGGWGNRGGISVESPNLENIVIRNNICSQNVQFQIASAGGTASLTVDHNLIDGYRNFTGETRGTQYVEGDPKFVDTSAAGMDPHLLGTSPALNQGSSLAAPAFDLDSAARPFGPGYDIGADEYTGPVAVESATPSRPGRTSLYALPNPFHPATEIRFALARRGLVRVRVYDLAGKMVAALVEKELEAGRHGVRFQGGGLPGGLYLCRLSAPGLTQTAGIILAK